MVAAAPARADRLSDAREHFERANSAYALGRFAEAADEFEKAFDLKPDPALLYNAAQAHRVAGNKPRALLLYQNYLRVFGDRISNAAEVQRHIDELKLAIDTDEKTKTSPPTGTIHPEAATPSPAPVVAPAGVAIVEPPPAPEKRHASRAWIWGVVAGAAVVVAAGVALGVVYGSTTRNPSPSMGVASGN